MSLLDKMQRYTVTSIVNTEMSAETYVHALQLAIVNVHLLPPIWVPSYGPIKSEYFCSSSSDYPGGSIQSIGRGCVKLREDMQCAANFICLRTTATRFILIALF